MAMKPLDEPIQHFPFFVVKLCRIITDTNADKAKGVSENFRDNTCTCQQRRI